MTNSVTVNGKTYTDDASPTTGLAEGGFRVRLVPMLADTLIDVAGKVSTATTSAATAVAAADAAAASAGSAAATQLTATSTTSVTPSIGDKTFTVAAGKQFVVGAPIYAVSAGLANVWMQGTVKSYSGTSLVIAVVSIGTATARTDWNITISGAMGQGLIASNTAFAPVTVAAAVLDLAGGQNYFKKTVAGVINFTFANVPATGSSITVEVQYDSGSFGFPASVLPPNGQWPTLLTGYTYLVVLVTSNGGTSWRASIGTRYANG